eukprot:6296350-Prymnesium_polylepis.3
MDLRAGQQVVGHTVALVVHLMDRLIHANAWSPAVQAIASRLGVKHGQQHAEAHLAHARRRNEHSPQHGGGAAPPRRLFGTPPTLSRDRPIDGVMSRCPWPMAYDAPGGGVGRYARPTPPPGAS